MPVATAGLTSLEKLVTAVRAAVTERDDWTRTAARVQAALANRLPSVSELPRIETAAADDTPKTRLLHAEPDGSFSVVALVCPQGAATDIHDHVSWCVFAVLAGSPLEERFVLAEGGTALEPAGREVCPAGTLTGGAPPGDVHRLSNPGPQTAVSLHVYGTDVSRVGSSVRRTYDLPILARTMEMTMTHPASAPANADVLEVPGARLHYEIRGNGPVLVLVGAPMNASSFAPLADLLAADHTVLTTDPRGINRSTVSDRDQDSTPEMRADDLSRLLTHLDAAPAAVFGSSGGAVSALALAQAHPEQVRTVIAHEPPLISLLEDHDDLRARTDDYVTTYLAGDVLEAWRKFFAAAGINLPDEAIAAMFGGERDPQTVADERFWFEHELRPSSYWRPDLAALARSTRIVVGVGEDSTGQECDRTSRALATLLDTEIARFPGDHIGFVHDPEPFAIRLRELLVQS